MKVRSCKGFSLIELMVVISILGIVLAIASPSFTRYRQNTNLKEATRALGSDIALIKQRAVAESTRYQITFDQGANNYTILCLDCTPSVPAVTKSPSDISSQVIISDITFTGTPPQITFQPRGTMSLGSVTLVNGIGSTGKITTNMTGRMYVQFDIK